MTTRAGFDALAPEWDALFDRAGRGTQVFQTFNWNWHWCNHYLSGDSRRSLAIVVGRQSGRMVMVWPLIAMRGGGLLQLSWMGEPVTQYGDVLVENSAASLAQLSDAWTHIVDRFKPDVVRLARVRDDAAIAPLMRELGAHVTAQQQAPYLDLSSAPDFDAYIERHSSHSRKKRRAAAKRLAKIAPAFSRHVEGREAARLARAAVEMKRIQLKERGLVSPAFADERIDGFFADAADGQGRSPGTLVYELKCDGELAALDILFRCKDRVAAHILAYAAKFQKESVGVHLLEHTIGAGHRRRLPHLRPAGAGRRIQAALGRRDGACHRLGAAGDRQRRRLHAHPFEARPADDEIAVRAAAGPGAAVSRQALHRLAPSGRRASSAGSTTTSCTGTAASCPDRRS